ncbi:hypothetical protein PKOR_23190 [Pontibacter korlensis]|uniref:Uncharacterized protein n=1 Tax=Pontibacter korlensis TaxID=400092 RepID=A0A0E3UYS9_9BACT|nr:hypothetical protein PKOR_23190 [Pontibacter korlensis]
MLNHGRELKNAPTKTQKTKRKGQERAEHDPLTPCQELCNPKNGRLLNAPYYLLVVFYVSAKQLHYFLY